MIPPPARGWLVDTNVISELRKGSRCSWAVRAWSERVPPVACFISRISLAEIRFGIDRVTDPAFRGRGYAHDLILAVDGKEVRPLRGNFFQLGTAQRLDLSAAENDARLKRLFNEIVMVGLTIRNHRFFEAVLLFPHQESDFHFQR